MPAEPDKMMQLQADIKHKAEDYREYLEDLKGWEDQIKKKDRTVARKDKLEAHYPPVRGTVSEEEVLRQHEEIKKDDPILRQKDLGNECYKKGKYIEAVKHYTKGIGFDPEDSNAHVLYANRAMANLRLEKYEEADKDATSCISLNRTFTKGFFRRAQARRALNRIRDACTDFETVLVLEPDNKDAKRELGELQRQIKQEEEEAKRKAAEPQRRRVAIEEVDDDDDDDDDDGDEVAVPINQKKPVPTPTPAPTATAPPTASSAVAPPAPAPKTSSRRMVIEEEDEDEDEEVDVPINCGRPAAAPQPSPAPAATPNVGRDPPPKHADPAAGTGQKSATSAAGKSGAKGKKPLAPREAAVRAAEEAVSRGAETVPTSFPHFERVWGRVRSDRVASASYLRLVPTEKYPEFFRANITEDILHDVAVILADVFLSNSRESGDAARAFGILQNLATVERMSALLIFLPDEASEKLRSAPKLLEAAQSETGASLQEIRQLSAVLIQRLDD